MFDDQRSVASRDGGNAAACCVDLRSTTAERAGDIVERSACALSDLIASREVSCAAVAAAYLDHIERTNPTYNAIVSLRERDDILADAREKDELLRPKRTTPPKRNMIAWRALAFPWSGL